MNKVDFNIEFAHIYADQEFGKEQLKSIEITRKIISDLESKNKTYCCTILIDDYHPAFSKLDVKKLISKIGSAGVNLDYVGFESNMVGEANILLEIIPKNMKKVEKFHHPQKDVVCLVEKEKLIGLEEEYDFCNRHSCALLSATWSLLRLGLLDNSGINLMKITEKSFTANNLITILPKRFEEVEKKVLEIIRTTKYREIEKNISYEFF